MTDRSDSTRLENGDLLIASPTLTDPNFRRAVVLVCAHDDNGSLGLVINRVLDVELPEELGAAKAVHYGGPVGDDGIYALHRHGQSVENAWHVIEDVYFGGDLAGIMDASRTLAPNAIRLFSGYAGWSAGQLLAEIAEGAWIVIPGNSKLIFDGNPPELWSTLMRRMGGQYAFMVHLPDDPSLN